jgi:hypothetical protein
VRVEIKKSSSHFAIHFWPYPITHNSWIVAKDMDPAAWEIAPARLTVGQPLDSCDSVGAREHAEWLLLAAQWIDKLDEAITKHEHFKQVRIEEWPKDEIQIDPCTTNPWLEISAVIHIPYQAAYQKSRPDWPGHCGMEEAEVG